MRGKTKEAGKGPERNMEVTLCELCVCVVVYVLATVYLLQGMHFRQIL